MKKVTIKYGLDSIEKSFDQDLLTIGDLRRNAALKATLGYGDNVNMLINGVVMSDDVQIPGGTTVRVETAANEKAA